MLTEGAAAEVIDRLRSVGAETEEILCSFRADLDRAGRSRGEWVIVTPRDIVVFDETDLKTQTARFQRQQLEGCRIEPAIGSLFLQVRIGGLWRDLARCTNRHRADAAKLAEKLDYWARRGEFPLDGTASEAQISNRRWFWSLFSRSGRRRSIFPRIWGIIRPYRWAALTLALLSLLIIGIGLVPPILEKILVDQVLDVKKPVTRTEDLLLLLAAIVGGLLSVRVASAVIDVWKGRVAGRVGAVLTADLRTRLVRKLHDLPVAYHDRNQVGMLMSRVAYDTEVMHTLVHQTSSGFLLQLLQLVGIGVMLFWLNPKLALFTMLPMPLVIAASWYFSRYLHPRHHHYWEAVGKQAAALSGMLSGIRVVKSFTQEEREYERFRVASGRLRDSRQNVDASTAAFAAGITFLFAVGQLIVWYVGGREVLAGSMTLGSLMAFLAYLWMFNAPLRTLAESTSWISNFYTASQRVFELLDTPNDIADPEPAITPEPFRGAIRFEHVTFAYGDGEPVLRDIDFEIRPGQMIGIVGRSGSGKSTLVSLIGRMYDPQHGRVVVDEVDVREMSRHDLRQRIGIVLQDPFLFRGSIAANIVYGRPEAAPEQILQAARAAYAHDFILRGPFAYDSQVGEGGSGLSGGERQRISIARALLYDPRILILDEATSSVDTESERAIQEALRDFAKGRTTIAIAHRLSTLRDADRLLVFDRGRLVEQGTHDELLARGGVYSSLVQIQTSLRRGVRQLQSAGVTTGGGGASPHDAVTLDLGTDAALFGADDEGGESEPPAERLRWLDPATARLTWEEPDGLRLEEEGAVHSSLRAMYCFPASHPEGFISLRRLDPLGGDVEVGLIRLLTDWPEPAQEAVRRSLNRRYLLRQITEIRGVRTAGDRLEIAVETETGPATFRLDPRGDALQTYGRNGRLLIDIDQNYFVIPDLDALPRRQRRLLALYLGT